MWGWGSWVLIPLIAKFLWEIIVLDLFLRVEIYSREFDGKVLLALVAAAKGHRVLVSNFATMMRSLMRRPVGPRLVLANHLEPSEAASHFHRIFKAAGCHIASLDEESGALWTSFPDFAALRYSEETVEAADAILCWGERDYSFLTARFPAARHKFHKTGSPRVDLWGPRFSSVYNSRELSLSKPFVLICTSIGDPVGWSLPHERIKEMRRSKGPAQHNWQHERAELHEYRDLMSVMLAYLDLVRILSQRAHKYKILLKPHPIEDPLAWNLYLAELPNVEVTDLPTSELIRQSSAVITSVSTTAIEAVFSGARMINFLGSATPYRSADLVGDIGVSAGTPGQVADIVESIISENRRPDEGEARVLPSALRDRFHSSESELAAERIIRSLEATVEDLAKNRPGGTKRMGLRDYRYWVSSAFPLLAPVVSRLLGIHREPTTSLVKYRRLNRRELEQRIDEMQRVLQLRGRVRYRFVGTKGVLFEPLAAGSG